MPPARTHAKRATKRPKKAAGRPAPRSRARRSSKAALGLPVLEQRHIDVLGLGLVAVGVFLVFPLWLGWEAGALGYPVSDEYDAPGGKRSDFQHGSITWSAATNEARASTGGAP